MEKKTEGVKNTPQTIAAIATAPGRGGVGVIRVSGENLSAFAACLSGKCPPPRLASLADFRAANGEAIDRGLLLYFPSPHSFTGEDVLELHGHGGRLVQQMLLARCLALGARLAEPGEFTQRAYLNGKLDLAQAEAVADLIDAASTTAVRSAMRSLKGEFSKEINLLQAQLTELRLLTEASLEFPEEDIDFRESYDIPRRVASIKARLTGIFERARHGQILQNGLQIVLAGQPNVGKSSLLNRLAEEELAIVTPIAGTTRDAIRSALEIDGIPLHIIDTAGLRETSDEIEQIGIARTWQEIDRADVLILLVDARMGVQDADHAILSRVPASLKRITVFNKIDLTGASPTRWHEPGNLGNNLGSAGKVESELGETGKRVQHEAPKQTAQTCISLSAKQGEGIDLLRQEILRLVGWQPTEDVFIARERHLQALAQTQTHINAAQSAFEQLELFAEELRLAQQALGAITGEFSADDLLGAIFSQFCIGK